MGGLEGGDPGHRRDDTQDDHFPGAPLDGQVAHLHQRPTGGQHGVAHHHTAPGEVGGQPIQVHLRMEGLFVTAQPDVGHLGQRDDLLNGLHHAQTGPQDRHDEDVLDHLAPRGAVGDGRVDNDGGRPQDRGGPRRP